ncbi:hypothetical protein ACQKQC_24530 [Vibrio fortis]|uniref:hypothetical protein n=1 Tax=Vibrio fortis TaxID=212667 RepID=UPI00406859DC
MCSRESELATDIDIWVKEVVKFGTQRVSVPDRAKSVSSHEFNDIERATLVAFDGYSAGYGDLISSLSRPLSQRHLIALKISLSVIR